jgi:hypothetical protein
MAALRRHSLMPCFSVTGYHITPQPGSHSVWDLRVDGRDGDAITVDGISVDEAQAFIKCVQRMLIHDGPGSASEELLNTEEFQDLRAVAQHGLDHPRPAASTDPEDPGAASSAPNPGPPSSGPEAGAAQEPYATGGLVRPGDCAVVLDAGCDYVLPQSWLNPHSGPWQSGRGGQTQFEVRFDQVPVASVTHVPPQRVHVKPGEVISRVCSCQPIAGGTLADDPNCRMHHAVPTVYVFDAS